MDAESLELLRSSLARVLGETADAPLSMRLAALGWDDVVADDRVGALVALFEIKGALRSSADALDTVMAPLLAVDGAVPDAVALPATLHPDERSVTVDRGRATGRGITMCRPGSGAGVAARTADALVLVAADACSFEPIGGIDPDLGLHAVIFDSVEVLASDTGSAADAWSAAVATGRWCLGAELTGLARRVVADAVAYTKDRHQYGKAIGTFQALQHRLADAHAMGVGSGHLVAEAAVSGAAWDALVAKAYAGQAAEEACRQAQQSYGAIGFTWEHDLHRFIRRCYVLDAILGGWRTLESEIGEDLLAERSLPRIGAL